ncbi:MAG: copper resistance protein CopC [Alphaproteobacteria bacterium]|nr:copper resistance protein CopC [Alphaproteobacteria bacterium]
MLRPMLLALAVSALAAGEASAHARLIHADPRVGSTVAAPGQLRLFFSETVLPAKSSVALLGPGARAVPLGPLTLDAKDPRIVVVGVPERLAPGAYKVQWGMTTADTHHTEGSFGFKVK